MSNPATKLTVKDEIAGILMKSPTGLGKNAFIQQIESTHNTHLIDECLENMRAMGDVIIKFKRYEMTPIGRSNYSVLNTVKVSSPEPEPEPQSTPDPTPAQTDGGIQQIAAFKTADGIIHDSLAAAEALLFRIHLKTSIDAFMADIDIAIESETEKNLITSYITRWESWRQQREARA